MSARKIIVFSCLAFVLAACTTSSQPPPGESLAGWKGNVKRNLPVQSRGVCPDLIQAYIDASGHSAYASTDPKAARSSTNTYICGVSLNQSSVEEAEARALRDCEAGTARWTNAFAGQCEIHASK